MKNIVKSELKKLLKPISWLAIRYQININEIIKELKAGLVTEAQEEIVRDSKQESISKISVMTGVHRIDVGKLVKGERLINDERNYIFKLIGIWSTNKNYLDNSGKPKLIETYGKQSEFSELVKTINSSLNSYTILNELLRIGVVKKEGSKIKLIVNSYVPNKESEENIVYLAEDSIDITKCIIENLEEEKKNHHLKTEFDEIPEAYQEEIKNELLKRGAKFHQEIQEYLSKFDVAVNPKINNSNAGKIRVAFGSFSITEKIKEE